MHQRFTEEIKGVRNVVRKEGIQNRGDAKVARADSAGIGIC